MLRCTWVGPYRVVGWLRTRDRQHKRLAMPPSLQHAVPACAAQLATYDASEHLTVQSFPFATKRPRCMRVRDSAPVHPREAGGRTTGVSAGNKDCLRPASRALSLVKDNLAASHDVRCPASTVLPQERNEERENEEIKLAAKWRRLPLSFGEFRSVFLFKRSQFPFRPRGTVLPTVDFLFMCFSKETSRLLPSGRLCQRRIWSFLGDRLLKGARTLEGAITISVAACCTPISRSCAIRGGQP